LIDILVYQETVLKGRRVFLDFTRNPSGGGILEDFSFNLLDKKAYAYLEKSGALFGTPIQRLHRMNQPAIDLYKDHEIDITKEYLEISVCAQHNNGGMKGNIWWESNIKHLFPVGEVNGTHGVYRPGGSALNSGQVGSMRAALYISKRYDGMPPQEGDFLDLTEEQIKEKLDFAKNVIDSSSKDDTFILTIRNEIQERMTAYGAYIRNPRKIREAIAEAWDLFSKLNKEMKIPSVKELPEAFKNLDLGLTHALYLEAIGEYIEKNGQSRGSYLVLNRDGEKPCRELGEEWKFLLTEEDAFVNKKILEVSLDEEGNVQKKWVDIRPVPQEDTWFENIWNRYMNDKIII